MAGPVLSTPRAGLSATTLMDGKVLIAGGNNGTADLATAEIFNSETGVVSPIGSSLAYSSAGSFGFPAPKQQPCPDCRRNLRRNSAGHGRTVPALGWQLLSDGSDVGRARWLQRQPARFGWPFLGRGRQWSLPALSSTASRQ